MPNRYIKETCVTSLTLTALSDAAERFFWRLTTVADDYGRFDANPDVLKGRCVPTLDWNKKKVEKCLAELCTPAPGDEVALVEVYQVRGRMYGRLTNWKQHQRDRSKEKDPPKPKFPGPEDGCVILPQPAASRGESRQCAALNESESESESENENENEQRARPQSAASALVGFDEFWSIFPRKDGKEPARKAWLKLSVDRGLFCEIGAAIERQNQTDQWKKDGGNFIPHAATWLNQRRWEDQGVTQPLAPQAKCAWSNTPCECYAVPGSKYCQDHRDKLKAIQAKVAGKQTVGEVVSIQTGELLSKIGRSM